MNQDKALRKSLSTLQHPLPYGFESQLMNRIIRISEKAARRKYILGIIALATVSGVMFSGAVIALNYYFDFNAGALLFYLQLPDNYLSWQWGIVFSAGLLLMLGDYFLRSKKSKIRNSF